MNKKVCGRIYAQYKTNKKIFVPLVLGFTQNITDLLNKKYGESWVLVDWVYEDEIIEFSDETRYSGFNPKISRYSDSIKKLK